MSMNSTPSSRRTHISFFGCRNAGKSSLVNAVTGQNLAVVSEVRGTTTDPVTKAMELLPLGPVVITDTPGYDDEGELGELRMAKTAQVLRRTDAAVLVIDGEKGVRDADRQMIEQFSRRAVPYVAVWNKCDARPMPDGAGFLPVSAADGTNVGELKERMARLVTQDDSAGKLVADLLAPGEDVVLVTPIDESAPRGRLILPQQQVIRDALDAGAVCHVARDSELDGAMALLKRPPALVVTDSQVFGMVSRHVPESIPLTSFSILMIRSKGLLSTVVRGARALDGLKPGDPVLICEGCTHHRQCRDIGTVKLPGWLSAHVGGDLKCDFTSGGGFPDDLTPYRLVVHCGGCMLNDREMAYRARLAEEQGIPFTNYGVAIAHMHGILARSVAPFAALGEI